MRLHYHLFKKIRSIRTFRYGTSRCLAGLFTFGARNQYPCVAFQKECDAKPDCAALGADVTGNRSTRMKEFDPPKFKFEKMKINTTSICHEKLNLRRDSDTISH